MIETSVMPKAHWFKLLQYGKLPHLACVILMGYGQTPLNMRSDPSFKTRFSGFSSFPDVHAKEHFLSPNLIVLSFKKI